MNALDTTTCEVGRFINWCKGPFGRRCALIGFGINQHEVKRRVYHKWVVLESAGVDFHFALDGCRIRQKILKKL